MKRVGSHIQRRSTWIAVLSGAVLIAVLSATAMADDRGFFVALALSSKSGPAGDVDYPGQTIQQPANFGDVDITYFDPTDDPNVFSFREYWAEISYGDVTIPSQKSRTFDFFNLPWRFSATPGALESGQGGDDGEDRLYWTELDNAPSVRVFNYGVGERVNETIQKYHGFEIRIDPDNGDRQLVTVMGLNDGFFTPGERFRDVNGSGNYTYVEFEDSNGNHTYDGDGAEALTAVDADENGQIDCPRCGDSIARRGLPPIEGNFDEPYEDFIVRYDPNAAEGERWVPVDDDYIAQNYPGFQAGLMERTDNGRYDSPDDWTENNDEADNPTLKVLDTGFNEPQYFTPAPSWLASFWASRYGTTAPAWNSSIARFEIFDPENPDPSTLPDDDQQREFRANQGCIGGGNSCMPDEVYPPDVPITSDSVLGDSENEYYDGPVEFDDLASSIYHDRPQSAGGEARWSHGDLRLGEVTSPINFENFGATVAPSDSIIPSAGPPATDVFGTDDRPAGNMLNLEVATWRNTPDSGVSATTLDPNTQNPGKAIWASTQQVVATTMSPGIDYQDLYAGGFRDFNLDGLIDQGETIPFDSEDAQYSNYANSMSETDNYIGAYPFNRTRLTEDMVEALDPAFNWNQLTDQNGPYAKIIYGVTLIAPQEDDPEAASTRERSPSYEPIRTNDTSTYFRFANLVGSLANLDENGLGDPPILPDFDLSVIVHEYGHAWEGWPDLYDEVPNDQGDVTINQPFGRFDLMSQNALVHPAPFLKENVNIGTGQFNTGAHRQHTPWISPVNLREVLTPGLAQTINIPPCEFKRRNAFYFFDNVAEPDRRERFYFWVVAAQGFDIREPGVGMLISHIDLGNNGATFPEQNEGISGGFYTYNLLQADGRRELESNVETDGIGPIGADPEEIEIGGTNVGDASDTWPGQLNKTMWNATTLPNNRWAEGLQSGLKILNITPTPDQGRAVTFLWDPKEVPSLSFLQPPGGDSNPCGPPNCSAGCEIYRLDYTAFDFYGGTDIEFYLDDDEEGFDGLLLTFDLVADKPGDCVGGGTTIVPKAPGTIEGSVPVNVGDLPNGEYYFYARLLPRTNSEGEQEPFVTDAYPSSANIGEGNINVTSVNEDDVKLETWTVFLNGDGVNWSVEGSQSGVQVNQAQAGVSYTTDDGGMSFTILAAGVPFAPGDRFVFLTTGYTPYSMGLKVRDGIVLSEPVAIFQPSPATGAIPLDVMFVSTSLDPTDETLTHMWDFGDGSTQTTTEFVTQHTYDDPGSYTVTLTVTSINGSDSTSRVVTAIINEPPVASFTVDPTSGVAPIAVDFDATASFDPEGTSLTLKWNFGDTTPILEGPYSDANVRMPTHTYQQLGVYTPTLTVTDGGNASASTNAVIQFTGNSAPFATFSATPTSGGAPLTVNFDATGSSDPDGDPITYNWDFGDGGSASGAVVQHTYNNIGDYEAKLTVSDGLASTMDSKIIEVQNQPPVASLTANPTTGVPPLTVTFDASGSFDPEGGALTYNWIFGDGSSKNNGAAVETHTYQTIGSFTARVTVIDPDNDSTIKLLTVTLTVPPNRAPNIGLTGNPMTGPATLNVSFDLSGTSDPDGDPVSLTMDFGDGDVIVNLLPTSQVSHVYQSVGTFTVLAVGSDGKGATGSAQLVVQVTGDDGGGGDGGTGQPAPGPCASGIAQVMVVGLVGLMLMSVGSSRTRRRHRR